MKESLKKVVPLKLRCAYHDLRFGFLKYFFKRKILLNCPIVTGSSQDNVEICSLTSHKDFLLLLFCLRTLFYFSKRRFNIAIHDDGSLTEKDCQILKQHLKNVRLIRRKGADKKLKKILKNKRFCQKYRGENPFMLKLLDIPLLAEKERIILLDSDFLFFKKPTSLLNWINKKDKRILYIKDCQSFYSLPLEELEKDLSFKVLPQLNSGLLCFPKKIFRLTLVEKYLKYFDKKSEKEKWSLEQTLYTLLVSLKKARALPVNYFIKPKRERVLGLTCRHYTSPIREYFYLDALHLMKRKPKIKSSFQKDLHGKQF